MSLREIPCQSVCLNRDFAFFYVDYLRNESSIIWRLMIQNSCIIPIKFTTCLKAVIWNYRQVCTALTYVHFKFFLILFWIAFLSVLRMLHHSLSNLFYKLYHNVIVSLICLCRFLCFQGFWDFIYHLVITFSGQSCKLFRHIISIRDYKKRSFIFDS